MERLIIVTPLALVSTGQCTLLPGLDCELPVLQARHAALAPLGSSTARRFERRFATRYRGRSAVVLRGLASGPSWRQARTQWRKSRLLAKFGRLPVWPSDLHRGCGLVGPRRNVTSVQHAMSEKGVGCVYLQPNHPLPRAFRKHFSVPNVMREVQLHGPSLSIGGLHSVAVLHRHEEAWLAQVFGHKLWLVGPPGAELPAHTYTRPCHHRQVSKWSDDGPVVVQMHGEVIRLARCVLGPTDVIYLPDHWAHATCAIGSYNVGVGFIGAIDGLPPLHRAAVAGDVHEVSTLLYHSENATLSNFEPAGGHLLGGEGISPLDWAAWGGHLSVVMAIEAHHSADDGAGNLRSVQALFWAAAKGHRKIVEWLTRSGKGQAADVTGPDGAKPSHWAAAAGHSGVISALVKANADPDARDAFGARPLHWLAGEGHGQVLATLLKFGSNPNAADDEGATAAHIAAQYGRVEVLQTLASVGGDLQAEANGGIRPVHLAMQANRKEAVDFLLA